jgi:hypothetical protein
MPGVVLVARFEHEERADHALGELIGFVHMRVVDERAGARRRDPDRERITGGDQRGDT